VYLPALIAEQVNKIANVDNLGYDTRTREI